MSDLFAKNLELDEMSYHELRSQSGLEKLDKRFLDLLKSIDAKLYDQLISYRKGELTDPKPLSYFLINLGSHLEGFIAKLFKIETEAEALHNQVLEQNPIFAFKKFFVLREAKRKLSKVDELASFEDLQVWLESELTQYKLNTNDLELAIATLGNIYLSDKGKYAAEIVQMTDWCVRAQTNKAGLQIVRDWAMFKMRHKFDFDQLVPTVRANDDSERLEIQPDLLQHRDGFGLTDNRMSQRQVLSEVSYCVYCHKNTGDYCSKGFPEKPTQPELGFKISPLKEVLTGCPLEEKISEMQTLKKTGLNIGALAATMIDNPMCPATGHRICNDCMAACIYQKQEPVNIPQVETGILTDVLSLPWGVEIYDLLTQWNPLRQTQYLPLAYNGKKVLVMGMGPAGFTLAHHLLMEGCAVVGADGLKIEPLPADLIDKPIYDYQDLVENLDDRITMGFGGVAEYGITVRWDKNFLKLIYITLARRKHFQVFGNVRFGGSLTIEKAWELGFDHLSVAVGAGLPRELHVPNSLAPGMRQANAFLMALQLTGAAKDSSLSNLQIRLPAIVIGGGLTGVDAATEVQAYYIKQVEKTLHRFEALLYQQSEGEVFKCFNEHDKLIFKEFLEHGRLVRAERALAKQQNRNPDLLKLIREWGGVTICYRRTMQESPAYRLNYEELSKAMEEGLYYAEGLEPKSVVCDNFGDCKAMEFQRRIKDEKDNWLTTDDITRVDARCILVATGAKPNVAYEFEHQGSMQREGMKYARYELQNNTLEKVEVDGDCKMDDFGAFTSYAKDDKRVSFLGDTHPVFHGSVVKAIASAKRSYPKIMQAINLTESKLIGEQDYEVFSGSIDNLFSAEVIQVKKLAENVVELVVRAPLARQQWHPGQFYRVQNFETYAKKIGGTTLQTEGIACLAAPVKDNPDALSFTILQRGTSSRMVSFFEAGEPLALMGPTGFEYRIPENQTVMIVGGQMAAIYVKSMGSCLRERGNRVLFVGLFNKAADVFCKAEIESVCDQVIWSVRDGDLIELGRKQDRSFVGGYVDAINQLLDNYQEMDILLGDVDQVLIVGNTDLLKTVQKSRQTECETVYKEEVKFVAAVYGSMQCMLKGVCAQCLQWQIDPTTGERSKAVYACSWQNQPLEMIDIDNIDERLGQNRMQETLGGLYLDLLMSD